MKVLSICLAAVALFGCSSPAEVVIEYDAEKQGYPDGLENLNEKAVAGGVCVMAGAQVSMGAAYHFQLFGQLLPFPIRCAVAGDEKRSATIKPIPSDRWEAKSIITVLIGKNRIIAFELVMPEPGASPVLPDEVVKMNDKLDNIDDFTRLIKTSMAVSQEAGEVPRAVLVVDSGTPFGKMVDTLRLTQLAGSKHGVVIMGNHFAAAVNLHGKMDPEVEPPIADNALVHKDEEGRIFINVRNDGTYTAEDFTILPDEGAIKDYIKKASEIVKNQDINPRLHLRGDREALFKHCRVAVKAAAKAGANQVIFASYVREQGGEYEALEKAELQARPRAENPTFFGTLSSLLQPRESDLAFRLPDPTAKQGKASKIDPLTITIKGDGSILVNDEPMDMDASSREVPLLDSALEFYKRAVDAAGEKPHVQIYAADKATHQRVIDVLNSLSGVFINSVAFIDKAEEKKGRRVK